MTYYPWQFLVSLPVQRYFWWRVVVINVVVGNAVGVGGGDVVLNVGIYVFPLVKSWDWESLGEEVTAPIGSSLALLAERSEAWCLLLLLLCLPLSRLFQHRPRFCADVQTILQSLQSVIATPWRITVWPEPMNLLRWIWSRERSTKIDQFDTL